MFTLSKLKGAQCLDRDKKTQVEGHIFFGHFQIMH